MTHDLTRFLPYVLTQVAESISREFEGHYRATYGMLRTEWRVLFHLGVYGDMTAKRICTLAALHKTKVSRAVSALEEKGYVTRRGDPADRRTDILSLSRAGKRVFADLSHQAEAYDRQITRTLTPAELARLHRSLDKLVAR